MYYVPLGHNMANYYESKKNALEAAANLNCGEVMEELPKGWTATKGYSEMTKEERYEQAMSLMTLDY